MFKFNRNHQMSFIYSNQLAGMKMDQDIYGVKKTTSIPWYDIEKKSAGKAVTDLFWFAFDPKE